MTGIRPLWKVPSIVARERRHPPGRARIPEPMVMDEPDSVAHFHAGGASNPGMQAVYDFSARAVDALLPVGGRLLDLGVGSGHALSAVLRRRPDLHATGVDLAPNMLATARELLAAQGLEDRVQLVQADITALPDDLAQNYWDGVSCVWTLHQLPDFVVLGAALHQIAAVRRTSGSAVWISDFQRLRDPSAAAAMISCVDPSASSLLRRDAIASEAAAFTKDELSAALAAAGLHDMYSGHARPLPYLQAHWAPAIHAKQGKQARRPSQRLPAQARRDAALLRWGFTAKPF